MPSREEIFADRSIARERVFYRPEFEIRADVYPPRAEVESKSPILLFIHGGGFMGSNREDVSAPL